MLDSDEFDELKGLNKYNEDLIDDFIVDVRQRQRDDTSNNPTPGTSREYEGPPIRMTPEERVRNLIKEAEASKARMHDLPGKEEFSPFCMIEDPENNMRNVRIDMKNEFVHSAMVDESYQLVASHLDNYAHEKIVKGAYVDFTRLVPKDRVMTADDNRYEMIIREGKTFWVPATNNEATAISNYKHSECSLMSLFRHILTGLWN